MNITKQFKVSLDELSGYTSKDSGGRSLLFASIALLASCSTLSSDPPQTAVIDAQACTQYEPMLSGLMIGEPELEKMDGVAQSCLALAGDAQATNSDIANGAFQAGGLYLAIADASDSPERGRALLKAIQALELSRNRVADENAALHETSSASDLENIARRRFKYDRVMQLTKGYIEIASEGGEAYKAVCEGKSACLHRAVGLLDEAETGIAKPFLKTHKLRGKHRLLQIPDASRRS